MSKFRIDKVVSELPTQLEADTVYAVRVGTGFDLFISDSTGQTAHQINYPDAGAIAAGSTLGLEQQLLANAGQVGLNVLAVGYTNSGKVQGVSLGAGNTVQVYASGADFTARNVLYREFMAYGEPICFTGLPNGAIITSTAGFYGFSEVDFGGTFLASMPLLSYGLSFTSSFMFAFREAERTSKNHAFLFIVNGPLESVLEVTFGNGNPISDQPPQTLAPWEFATVHLDGNTEYAINASNPVMVCTASGFNNSDFTSTATPTGAGPRDARLILPLSADIITHPRFGQMSAPFPNTPVEWYSVKNTKGGFSVSPGSPVNIQTETGLFATDYRPSDFARFRATGQIMGNSGADNAGGDATPACPVSAMSQVVAQPIFITDSGAGAQSSLTIAGPSVGTAKVWEWNDTTKQLDLAYTVPLNRQGVTVTTPEDQLHPVAGQVANEPDAGVITLIGNLKAGLVTADVPIMVIAQSSTTSSIQIRSQNGQTSNAKSFLDETLMFGVTPERIAFEGREDANGLLRKRTLDDTGILTWPLG